MMDVSEIQKLLPHRYPFLLVDRVVEYEEGQRLVGFKNVTSNEQFFQGHFPGHPVMPGVLILEALAQACALLAYQSVDVDQSKFVVYLMSCNVSEIFAVALGVLAQGPMPILPLQILFLNLVTDVFPALALGVGEGSPALMRDPPRNPQEPVLARRHWLMIFALGIVMALSVLAALAVATLVLALPAGQAPETAPFVLGKCVAEL